MRVHLGSSLLAALTCACSGGSYTFGATSITQRYRTTTAVTLR